MAQQSSMPPGFVVQRRRNPRRIALLGCLGLLGACAVLAVIVSLLPNPRGSGVSVVGTAVPTVVVASASTNAPSQPTVAPTEPLQIVSTSAPTEPPTAPTLAPTVRPVDSPTPKPEPTRAPVVPFAVTSPRDGARVREGTITVQGTGTPGQEMTHDLPGPDEHATPNASGRWQMQVRLQPGENNLKFRQGEAGNGTERTLRVTYVLPPTPTPEPTDTPEPTATPVPTDTPEPTATPTPLPKPVTLSGRGQDVTRKFVAPGPVSIARFEHSGESNFIVTAYGPEGEDLLVNEIGDYTGSRPLFGEGTYYFDVDADGPWSVTIEAAGRQQDAAAGISGRGDFVSGLFEPAEEGPAPYSFSHDGDSNFVVLLHCGGGSELVQNEIGRVDGSSMVNLSDGPCLWEVEADGSWSLGPRGSSSQPADEAEHSYTIELYADGPDNDPGVNLRARPAAESELLAEIPEGELVEAAQGTVPGAGKYDWRPVRYEGQEGYIRADLLSEEPSAASEQPSTSTGEDCDPNYSGACVPVYPPDVDCGDIAATGFMVVGEDVHGLDGRNENGIACE